MWFDRNEGFVGDIEFLDVTKGVSMRKTKDFARSSDTSTPHCHADAGCFLHLFARCRDIATSFLHSGFLTHLALRYFDNCRLRVPPPSESDTTRPTLPAVDVERCLITFRRQLARPADTLLPRSESTAMRRPEADALLELVACVS